MAGEPARYTLREIAEAVAKTDAARSASWEPSCVVRGRGRHTLDFYEAANLECPGDPDLASAVAALATVGEIVDWALGYLKRSAANV